MTPDERTRLIATLTNLWLSLREKYESDSAARVLTAIMDQIAALESDRADRAHQR